MNLCKGICERFKAKDFKGKIRYEIGQKHCSKCSVFISYQKVRCPCCQCILRITPRSNRCRKDFQERKDNSRY